MLRLWMKDLLTSLPAFPGGPAGPRGPIGPCYEYKHDSGLRVSVKKIKTLISGMCR